MSFETGPSAAPLPSRPARVPPLVTGAVLRPAADVRLDGYGHAWIAPTSLAPTTLAPLNDEEEPAEGPRGFARHAAPRRAALLDGLPQGCGRDAAALARLSAKGGVAIAAVTGLHLPAYDPTGRRPWVTADAALIDPIIASTVVGINTPEQLHEVLAALEGPRPDPALLSRLHEITTRFRTEHGVRADGAGVPQYER